VTAVRFKDDNHAYSEQPQKSKFLKSVDLKVPKYEIFDDVFLHQKSPYGPVIHDLKWFRI
jgi:hypothetical protein